MAMMSETSVMSETTVTEATVTVSETRMTIPGEVRSAEAAVAERRALAK